MSLNADSIISRRRFMLSAAALAASGVACQSIVLGQTRPAEGPRPRGQALYGLVILGDLHYDKMEHHDMDWVHAEKPKDISQIENYVEVTRTHTPRLFERVKQTIAQARAPIVGVVQVGDFVEGLCGSRALQERQSRDAIAFVEQSDLGVPFLMCKGNHDITGPGADEAFDAVLLPWMAGQAGATLSSANYHWSRGDDLFVFFDAYKPDLNYLASIRDEAAQARHVFFVIHPPVVPYNARANWHVFSRESQADERAQLIAWLERVNAVVLSGHLHRYCHLRRTGETGGFTQLAINSVVRNDTEQALYEKAGVADYSAGLLDLEPNFSPSTREDRRAWIERERPSITSFDYARSAGYATLWVYADRVEADIYLGYADEIWKQRVVEA